MYNLIYIIVFLLIVCLAGYALAVMKEKINLKLNVVVIDNKAVTQEQIDEADIKIIYVEGKMMRAGDEIQLKLDTKETIKGILLGVKGSERQMLVFTHSNELKRFAIDTIDKIKITSKYGRFFNF